MHTETVFLLLLGIHFSIGHFNTEQNLFKAWKNSTFYAFRGIKYGEAPTGSLRIKVIFNRIFVLFPSTFDKFYQEF